MVYAADPGLPGYAPRVWAYRNTIKGASRRVCVWQAGASAAGQRVTAASASPSPLRSAELVLVGPREARRSRLLVLVHEVRRLQRLPVPGRSRPRAEWLIPRVSVQVRLAAAHGAETLPPLDRSCRPNCDWYNNGSQCGAAAGVRPCIASHGCCFPSLPFCVQLRRAARASTTIRSSHPSTQAADRRIPSTERASRSATAAQSTPAGAWLLVLAICVAADAALCSLKGVHF